MDFLYDLYIEFGNICAHFGYFDDWSVFCLACLFSLLAVIIYVLLFFFIYKRSNKYVKILLICITLILVAFSCDVVVRIIQWNNFSYESSLDLNEMNYNKIFKDRNNLHLPVARKIGVQPIQTRDELYKVKDKLVKVSDNRYYVINHLTYSMPYLTPDAAALLQQIGINFQDSLESKKLPKYRIIVTSLFRSRKDVLALHNRGGKYAPQNDSPHAYGITFDIAINSFCRYYLQSANSKDLTFVLAEVLRDLREQDKCYVLYEETGCFHISVREPILSTDNSENSNGFVYWIWVVIALFLIIIMVLIILLCRKPKSKLVEITQK